MMMLTTRTLICGLLAQADSLSGAGGWAGAGLLGLVLAWLLLRHLPEKDKQIKELIDRHLTAESAMRDAYVSVEREQRRDFRAALDTMLSHNKNLFSDLAIALRGDIKAMHGEAITALKELHSE